jgi:hypothetical protein
MVRPTARHSIHLQFGISANALEIRAYKVQCVWSDVLSPVQCKIYYHKIGRNDIEFDSTIKNSETPLKLANLKL